QDVVVADDDEGHPRQAGVFGGADREAIDVVAARGKHAGHMGQHAGDVLHESREDVTHEIVLWIAKNRTFDHSCEGVGSQVGGRRLRKVSEAFCHWEIYNGKQRRQWQKAPDTVSPSLAIRLPGAVPWG